MLYTKTPENVKEGLFLEELVRGGRSSVQLKFTSEG